MQGALETAGPFAADLARLFWIFVGVAAVVYAVVIGWQRDLRAHDDPHQRAGPAVHRRMSYLRASSIAALLFAATARAHVPSGAAAGETPVFVPLMLAVAALLYGVGLWRLARRVQARRPLAWRAAAFAVGWAALAVALLSPIDSYATSSFAVHMVQHEMLMLLAAPLLVSGRALPTFLWALPASARRATGRFTNRSAVRTTWEFMISPLVAWWLHAAALWLWHVPAFFNAAVNSTVLHDLQHLSFLATALLFWHALLRHGSHARQGMAVVYLFTTTVHTGVRGALLTFAREPLYGGLDRGLSIYWGLTSLEDQQLGGLIMWVQGAMVYVGIALAIMARWLREQAGDASAARQPRIPG